MDSRNIDLYVKILLETDEIASRMRDFGITAETWRGSRALRDLIFLPLIQIGELTTQFKDRAHLAEFPEVPWREVKGFRNVVVHGYGQIDVDVAWLSATRGVDEMRSALLANDDVRARYNEERSFMEAREDQESLADLIGGLPSIDYERNPYA